MTDYQDPEARPARVSIVSNLVQVITVGALLATIFTAWTPLGLVPYALSQRINNVFTPPENNFEAGDLNPTPRPRAKIGIVAGHWQFDTGAVCSDGLTEEKINLEIATRVRDLLITEGFDVDLLAEFDSRLASYQALTLVSIHADTCSFISNEATGFKVARAFASAYPEKGDRLAACMISRYAETTKMNFHPGSVTADMQQYHAFDEIHADTTAAIIETGFMNLDRQMLTENQDLIAKGIVDGILCYIRNEDASGINP